ncbi:MAG: type I-E CRISPR-associated protein Cse2/CasB [Flavobacteriales bacterium]
MSIDFRAVAEQFEKLGNGPRAELRRCATPDDMAMVPAFYRLFFGETDARHRRVAFFLPYAKHASNGDSLGAQLARGNISEKRLFQVLRSEPPNDLIQLRRLVQQVEPKLNWTDFGKQLFFWNDDQKRRILEAFFMNQSK